MKVATRMVWRPAIAGVVFFFASIGDEAKAVNQALSPDGTVGDEQTSIIYDANTGEISVDAPAGTDLTSINIESASNFFTGAGPSMNLAGAFDIDPSTDPANDNTIFKATLGSSFGTLSFGNLAQSGLTQAVILADFTADGALLTTGDLGDVDLIYVAVPEPSAFGLVAVGLITLLTSRIRKRR